MMMSAMIGLVTSCKKSDPIDGLSPLALGYTILVHDGNVLVSGLYSEDGNYKTNYWVNGQKSDQASFAALLNAGALYQEGIGENSRTGYQYKDEHGQLQQYQFSQGPAEEGRLHYYVNNELVNVDSDSLGQLATVTFHEGRPVFAGTLGEWAPTGHEGIAYYPKAALVWDGESLFQELMMPEQQRMLRGVSALYYAGPDEIYVGGLCDIPMYWKNEEVVILDERYGEVQQITKSGSNLYAVGLINKYNSNSTGHTACYWKNGALHELEDQAQAYGIYIDGANVYVTGSVGNVPIDYRPCYWKNGVRVDLPI